MAVASNNLSVPQSKKDFNNFLLDNYRVDISSVGSGFNLTNGHVQYILLQNKAAPVVEVSEMVHAFYVRAGFPIGTLESVKAKIRRSNADFGILLRNVGRNWHLIHCQLNNLFINPNSLNLKRPLEVEAVPSQVSKRPNLSVQNDKENCAIDVTQQVPENSETPLSAVSTRSSQCNQCFLHKQSLVNYINNLKDKLRSTKKAFKNLKINFNYKRINQKLKRQKKLIINYRDEKRILKKKNAALILENEKLRDNLYSNLNDKKLLHRKRKSVQHLKEKNKKLQAALLKTSAEIKELNDQLTLK